MKNFILSAFAIFLSLFSFAQAPEKMSYQAIIRDNSNQLVVNQAIKMRVGIYRNSVSGTKIFEEVHTPTTNVNGLVSIQLGSGAVSFGSMDTIKWENGPYFMKREIDLSGIGTNYNITGSSELLSVPYALHAKKVENYSGGDYKLNYHPPIITQTMSPVTVLTTNQNWQGNRRILMNGYINFEITLPPSALSNNVNIGLANISLYLKYDGQTIMPLDLKNFMVKEGTHITLPLMALIPNSTSGSSKQFSIVCTANESHSAIFTGSSEISYLYTYDLDLKLNVVLTWVEL